MQFHPNKLHILSVINILYFGGFKMTNKASKGNIFLSGSNNNDFFLKCSLKKCIQTSLHNILKSSETLHCV
jgi:hypothetical protein